MDMTFITVDQFKTLTGTEGKKIQFSSVNEGKLFAICANGKSYKAQATLDHTKPVRFMYSEDEGFDNGCFANVKELETKFSL